MQMNLITPRRCNTARNRGAKPGTGKGDFLDGLVTLVEVYEC
jgi:hypothetical protein